MTLLVLHLQKLEFQLIASKGFDRLVSTLCIYEATSRRVVPKNPRNQSSSKRNEFAVIGLANVEVFLFVTVLLGSSTDARSPSLDSGSHRYHRCKPIVLS